MRHSRLTLSTALIYVLLTAGVVVMIFPFLDMISTAFQSQIYVLEVPPTLMAKIPFTCGN